MRPCARVRRCLGRVSERAPGIAKAKRPECSAKVDKLNMGLPRRIARLVGKHTLHRTSREAGFHSTAAIGIGMSAEKPWIVPIPGTRNIDHLNESSGALDVELTPEDLREIDTALCAITLHGGGMNVMQMVPVDRPV